MAVRLNDLVIALDNLTKEISEFSRLDDEGIVYGDSILERLVELYGDNNTEEVYIND